MTRAPHTDLNVYASAVARRRGLILTIAAAVVAAGTALALNMPLRADLSNLLPPQEKSVRDLERIERRTQALGLGLVVIASDNPALRARGAQALVQRLAHADPALVGGVLADDAVARRFAWDHKFLNASVADLRAAQDALRQRITWSDRR